MLYNLSSAWGKIDYCHCYDIYEKYIILLIIYKALKIHEVVVVDTNKCDVCIYLYAKVNKAIK